VFSGQSPPPSIVMTGEGGGGGGKGRFSSKEARGQGRDAAEHSMTIAKILSSFLSSLLSASLWGIARQKGGTDAV